MDTPEGRIRMMVIATIVCLGLCAAIYVVTPPPPAPAQAAMDCGSGEPCAGEDPLCYRAPTVAAGVCTRSCTDGTGCRKHWCCLDHLGTGDARYFVCAPPDACDAPENANRRVTPGQGSPGGPR